VDVTTLTDVAVVVAPGAVEVMVVGGEVEVIVAVLVDPAPPTVVVVVLTEVEVIVAVVAVPAPGTRVAGGKPNVANPVFGGCALSCELTTMLYAVALTSVGSVPMLSGPDQTFVVVE